MRYKWFFLDRVNEIQLYDIPPYLQRKKPRRDWRASVRLVVLIAVSWVVLFVVIFMSLFMIDANRTRAAEAHYSGVIKDGEILTPETFCASL